MKLNELFYGLDVLERVGPGEGEVLGIAYDSRRVAPGFLYVALRGLKADGHSFVRDALERGAMGVVVEKGAEVSSASLPISEKWSLIVVYNSRRALAHLAARFYSEPAKQLRLIGVTGTNGKTTTAYLIHSIAEAEGIPTGLLGTICYRIGPVTLPASHTTPESLELHGLFSKMVEKGMRAVVMEVSSHALALGRVWGCDFEVALFTNLTQDHLDFHGSLEDYFQAKLRLFKESAGGKEKGEKEHIALLNGDDPWSKRIQVETSRRILTYAVDTQANLMVKEVRMDWEGISFLAVTPQGVFPVISRLVGRHNIYNILAAVGAGLVLGCSIKAIQQGIQMMTHVPGRFEKVEEGQGYGVVIDYAHTEDALFRLLSTAASLTRGRLITVFGCGGDRDRGKRPKMGRVAAQWSDLVLLTSDNPRSEEPGAILREIEVGVLEARGQDHRMQAYWVVPDRREAIEQAIAMAHPGDLVLIAGKGHEDYQIIGGERLHFDDSEVAREAIRKQGGPSTGLG